MPLCNGNGGPVLSASPPWPPFPSAPVCPIRLVCFRLAAKGSTKARHLFLDGEGQVCIQVVFRSAGIATAGHRGNAVTTHSDEQRMSRNQDPFQIPRAGWEAAPSAGLASIDINANGGAVNGGEFVLESSLGGVVIYAGYQALLTALRTEALRQRGVIDRATQIRAIGETVWSSTKQGAVVSLALGLVLLVFPWLSWPLAVLGFVGMGKASLDLFHAFWDGLDEVQRAELLAAANEAGVNLRRFFDGEQGQPGNQLA